MADAVAWLAERHYIEPMLSLIAVVMKHGSRPSAVLTFTCRCRRQFAALDSPMHCLAGIDLMAVGSHPLSIGLPAMRLLVSNPRALQDNLIPR